MLKTSVCSNCSVLSFFQVLFHLSILLTKSGAREYVPPLGEVVEGVNVFKNNLLYKVI